MSDDTTVSKLQGLRDTNALGRIVAYLVYLSIPVVGLTLLVLGVRRGYVSPSLTADVSVSFDANLGWVLEALAVVTTALYAVFGLAMLVRITGVGFLNSVIDVATDMMDGYSKEE